MTSDTDELCSVPCKEVSGELADARRMSEFAEADRASLALVSQAPAQAEEADAERSNNLDVLRGDEIDG